MRGERYIERAEAFLKVAAPLKETMYFRDTINGFWGNTESYMFPVVSDQPTE